jgi:murein DD-endopeptidase MepM/ murein hydrolase activator NlpD
MPEGTAIHAARSGIVVEIKENSNVGGNDRKYLSDANYISIYHSDGTFGNYVHIKYNGVLVKLGQIIKEGQIIGLSGNTGFTSGPHLHFSVDVPKTNGNRISIPIQFLSYNNKGIIPQVEEYYETVYP